MNMDLFYAALGIAIVAALRDYFWWIAIAFCLWIGRKILKEKWGLLLFGHYWVKKKPLT
jgi:hypothetical protein